MRTLTLIRTNGVTGDADSDFEWRWTPTAEQRLLARGRRRARAAGSGRRRDATREPSRRRPSADRLTPALPAAATPTSAHAPQRTRDRSASTGPAFADPIATASFAACGSKPTGPRSPPVELWRRPIGPGWSSFAVAGDRLFTQEQRGDDEIVSAYNLKTGEPVWRHRDAARFWESNAGAGPRATPTLSNGRVYTLGGTGILNALDARDGSVVWSRNAATDTGTKFPDWGIASSPLVVGDVVIVATAGSLAAYDIATGKPRWFGPKDGWGYSSPHLATIDGVAQVVLLNGPGAIGVAPSDGTVLWKHEWAGDSIVQPAVIAGRRPPDRQRLGAGGQVGMRRLAVAHEPGRMDA